VKVLSSAGFALTIVALLVLAVATFWSFQTYARVHSLWAALERSSNFAQATMTLGLLLVARYYGILPGRQLRFIAISFGAWASISTANNAMIDLFHSFLPYWQVLRPLSFVAMIAAWNWALWQEAADPLPAESVHVPDLGAWTKQWDQAQSSLRRVKPL
jgi:hypothetical protein